MNVYALDKDFNLVAIGLPYDNLQWNRKYYEAGQFQMQIAKDVFDPSWKYILTDERPEVGMVQRREKGEGDLILVSGFFCEKMLDFRAIYPRFVIMTLGGGDPTVTEWVEAAFSKYKDGLNIRLGNSSGPDDRLQATAVDDKLGEKLYSVLQTFEASYRIRYDNGLVFEVWKGKDRTQSQRDNSWCVFSKEFGNVKSDSVTTDDSDYYNYAIVPCDADEDGVEREVLYVDLTNGEPRRDIVIDMRSSSVSDDQTMAQWRESVRQEATEKLLDYAKVEDIDIEVLTDSGYMTDYDLGDRCDVVLTDMNKVMESRIIEVLEVFKPEGHEITIGLGNKRISNIRRAVNG